MNKLAGGFGFLARVTPLIAIMMMPRLAEAAVVEFNFDVFVDHEGDPDITDCTLEPVDDFYCIPNIQVGDRVGLTFAVDTATRVEPPAAYYESFGVDPFIWGTFGVWSTTIQTGAGPYTPHLGQGREYDGLPIFSVVDGPTDIFEIYAPTAYDGEPGGGTRITLSDATGSAIDASDLASAAAFENWVLHRFDASLFDVGHWDLSTYDGGAGAGGRIDVSATEVPEPSMLALMLAAVLGLLALSRPQQAPGFLRR
jgi:hypothetical protein